MPLDLAAQQYTVKRLMARLSLSKAQIQGCIRRGDLHVQRYGGRSVVIEPAEAEAFIRFIESARVAAPDPDRSRGSYCQGAPGGRCLCRCHLIRAARARSPIRPPRGQWLGAHDQTLRELVAAGMSPERIADSLSARFHVPRTCHAVRLRIRKLGLSTRDGWVSGEDLIRNLGVYRRRIAQYEAGGLLERAAYGRWRRYSIASVERLIATQAGRTIDPRRIKHQPWRSLAEVSAIANARVG